MADKKRRLTALLAANPICYFCATAPSTTEDHVPSRECFKDRIGPEGYGFAACQRCNNSAGQYEQAVALALLLGDHSTDEPSTAQFRKLTSGVANNNPELMPIIRPGARAARQHFRNKGMSLPPGQSYADTTILELPVAIRPAFNLFARRLTCALFYKEAGRPMPLDWMMAVAWSHIAEPASVQAAATSNSLFPAYTLTKRTNTSIGDQFHYRWGYHPEGNLFGFMAQFSKSFLVFGCAVAPEIYNANKDVAGWEEHSTDVA